MGVRYAPAFKGTNVTLSSNDTVATGSTSAVNEWALCLPSVNPYVAGKFQKVYIEFHITTGDAGGGHLAVGMAKSVDTITWLGAPGRDSFGYWSDGSVILNNSTIFTAPTYTTGDRIQIAWDNATSRAWVRKNGGAWANSGDPVAGTGGIQMDTGTANALRNFAAEPGDSGVGGSITLKSKQSEWSGTPPTGFSELARGVVQSKVGGSALATVTPTFDYAITAGNQLLLCVASDAYLNTVPPTGFTTESNCSFQNGSGNNMGWGAYRKTAVGGDTVSYTQTTTANSAWLIVELEGLDGTTPFNIAAGGFTNSLSGAVAQSRTATPTGTAEIIGIFFGGNQIPDAGVATNPWTSVLDGGDEFAYGGQDTVIRMGVGAAAFEGTAPTAITGGMTAPQTSSGNHTEGGILMLFNVATSGTPASVSGSTIVATASIRPGKVERGIRLWRRAAAGKLKTTNLYRKDKYQAGPALNNLEFFGVAITAGGASVSGATLTATASIIPGTATAAVAKSGVTLTATASVISGTATTGTSQSGVTLTATASIISGTATYGVTKGAVTLTATASIISGTPTYGWVVAGQTLTATASIIAGTASAGGAVNQSGVTLTCTASIISGTATAGVSKAGVTLTCTASIIAGTASAGVSKSGVTLTATASIISGTATGGAGGYTFPGTTLAASAILLSGIPILTASVAGGILSCNAILIPATRFGQFEWVPIMGPDSPWVSGTADPDIWIPKASTSLPWN